jgi:hypothetical protein
MRINGLKWMIITAVVVTVNVMPTWDTGAVSSERKVVICHSGQTKVVLESGVEYPFGDTVIPWVPATSAPAANLAAHREALREISQGFCV